jgi:hypothetical protein
MSDHGSGPRALADPVIDINDMYAFPTPGRPGTLTLVLDVFPFAAPAALFSDAVDYRFRLRPLTIPVQGFAFVVGDKEVTLTCRFGATVDGAQEGTIIASTGQSVALRVNDERGGQAQGLRAFAGIRLDPFFFDGGRMAMTMKTGKLSFEKVGQATVYRQNTLAIVVELDIAAVLGADDPLFGIVAETARSGPMTVRFERYGRTEVKNFLLMLGAFDPVNKGIDLRDLFNQEDAFRIGPAYQSAYRSRMSANLAFYDRLDGKTDWPLDAQGAHPLTELLLADFMIVDVSKPFSETSYLEIEQAMLHGEPHKTCGGRSLNEDATDKYLTMLVNNGNGPAISDGIDHATVPATNVFPYLAAPEMHPPALNMPSVAPAKS